jgi:hypothetical protein
VSRLWLLFGYVHSKFYELTSASLTDGSAPLTIAVIRSAFSFFQRPASIGPPEQNIVGIFSLIDRLKSFGLNFQSESSKSEVISDKLKGKTIVISGNFSISREAIGALIESHSGRNSSSVSSKTDYLLAGEKAGPSKLEKAAKLGVAIITEEEFMNMINN